MTQRLEPPPARRRPFLTAEWRHLAMLSWPVDPALLRPGRFDREVTIDLPDVEGREEILRVHLKKVKCGPDADVKVLARSTPGYSGADLAAIINEAAIRAALAKKDFISMEDLEEARDKVRYGRQ